nr:MAG TPA: hypothetical protein [Caudoviricetes sp.]
MKFRLLFFQRLPWCRRRLTVTQHRHRRHEVLISMKYLYFGCR